MGAAYAVIEKQKIDELTLLYLLGMMNCRSNQLNDSLLAIK